MSEGKMIVKIILVAISFHLSLPYLCVYMLNHLVGSDSFVTLWTVACQEPLSMGFPRQEYWSGLPFSFSRGYSWPRNQTCISCIGRWVLYHWATWRSYIYYATNALIHISPHCFLFLYISGSDLHKHSCRRLDMRRQAK